MELKKSITHGIAITVRCDFMEMATQNNLRRYLFAYQISIHNTSEYVVQLLHRHWDIFDSIAGSRVVSGEGVVGEQPILQPGEFHKYSSMCPIESTYGNMGGYYTFIRLEDNDIIKVKIPQFDLVFPGTLN